ncbi:hypothetical protein [Kineothrix sedimenti]|uniref:4Fe-4S ferredoxin-type domain-containing protein n=1 Tax=Kineothrix sedimenti TaxID=3123317 RepID=A0ABZ3ES21_9FIRM
MIGKLETSGGHYWGKRIKVLEHCTQCGWCAGHCPSGNIAMLNGKPTFGDGCHFCLKCIYGCPIKALQPEICKFVAYRRETVCRITQEDSHRTARYQLKI